MFHFKEWRTRRELRKFRDALATMRHADDDILNERQKSGLDELIGEGKALKQAPMAEVAAYLAAAPGRVARLVPPKRFPALREWLDIIAVAMAVAFGVRGLFLQPFKIPTSSMQPTLYGIHFMEKKGSANSWLEKLPSALNLILFSARPATLVLPEGGHVDPSSLKRSGNALFDFTSFRLGGQEYRLPGDPRKVLEYSGIDPYTEYRAGDVICDGYLSLGDHLFVDRVSHNLTGLRRGDVVVFNTEGIRSPDGRSLTAVSGYYYIKRLVGLPGDTLKIVGNQLLVRPAGAAEFKPIQELAPVFRKLYSGQGGYQGHTNTPGEGGGGYLLSRPEDEFTVPADSYFMLGDNTRFSADSRLWGVVPRRNIVGRALVVFWPFSRRWGWVDRAEPLPVPTGEAVRGTYPAMYLQ